MSKCFGMFDKWIREVPVIGFNSAKYDCNIMKVYYVATYSFCPNYFDPNLIRTFLIQTFGPTSDTTDDIYVPMF